MFLIRFKGKRLKALIKERERYSMKEALASNPKNHLYHLYLKPSIIEIKNENKKKNMMLNLPWEGLKIIMQINMKDFYCANEIITIVIIRLT
jgi:hypothetical protein